MTAGPGRCRVDGFTGLPASLPEVEVALIDGNWLLLAEGPASAQRSLAAVTEYARGLAERATAHRPVLLYLADDVAAALRRRHSRDGDERYTAGIRYLRGMPALAQWRDRSDGDLTTAPRTRMRSISSDVGIETIEISAGGSRELVLARALQILLS